MPPSPRATRTAATVDTVEAAARLRLAATRLARRLRQNSSSGLTPSQHAALATIERCGSLTLGRLAEAERVAAPTITRVVALLEDRGLVERRPDPGDRRATLVQLTEDGRTLMSTVRRQRTAWLVEQLESLDPDQVQRLVDALDVLESIGEDDGPGAAS